MNERFQVCFIKPPGYEGSLVFRELLFLLRNSLRSLGHECQIAGNSLDPQACNIIVGYHLLAPSSQLNQCRYIPYQLEQLDSGNPWFNEAAGQVLRGAEEVWDFSNINRRFLSERDIDSRFVPLGYHPSLEIIPEAEKDIDVLFYGSINERRKKLLEELSEKARLHVAQGVFGGDRYTLIARSRIVLNMHYYPTRILETVRISFLLNNGCFVITEDADDDPWPEVDLITAPYDALVESCLDWLSRPRELEERAALNRSQFAGHYAMAGILARVIG